MQKNKWRGVLLFWCLFIGIGAVGGSACMLIDPTGHIMGMEPLLPAFQVLPFADVLFQNFTFPGIALLVVNGLSNLLAAVLILRKKPLGLVLGTIFGFTLMLWITIQFFIFEFNALSTSYFVFGCLQLLAGHLAIIADKRAAFAARAAQLPTVPEHSDTLVVYFSRRGYVRLLAYQAAHDAQAEIVELKTPEVTQGASGFAWCGRFAMHRWPMPICELGTDPSAYAKVIFVTPLWVFNVCAPMRQLMMDLHGKLRQTEYVIVHFRKPQSIAKAVATMDSLTGVKASRVTNICCQLGKCRTVSDSSASGVSVQG